MKTPVFGLSVMLALLLPSPEANAQEVNYALELNGAGDHVDLGNAVGMNIRTIEFWFRSAFNASSSGNFDGYSLVVRNDGTQAKEYGFYIRGTDWPSGRGYLYFFMRQDGVLHEIRSNGDAWDAGAWHHVCGTIDANAGMSLYIDGVLQSQTDPAGTAAITASGGTTTIGTWGDANIRYFPGRIDELRFWNRALPQSEIQSDMCFWLAPANSVGLVAYWKMNEGNGTTLVDSGIGGYDGSIVGASYIQDDLCFQGTLGIGSVTAPKDVLVSPNPFSDKAILSVPDQVDGALLTVENSLGQIVYERGNIRGGNVELPRGNLSCGVYQVRLIQAGRTIASGRVVISAQ